jgi:hypothetical protein
VGGGQGNSASQTEATVAGGRGNNASGQVASVGGGYGNTASGSFSIVPGGEFNVASADDSLAAGHNALAGNPASFVWSDGATASAFSSTDADQFDVHANGGARIVREQDTFAGTGAALQVEHGGTSGEAAWLNLSNASNPWAVLQLNRPSGSGDFLRCYQTGTNVGQKCHIDSNGSFVGGSDFAESFPARGGKARYQAGDVLSISRTKAGQVLKSRHPFDRALIGVYS